MIVSNPPLTSAVKFVKVLGFALIAATSVAQQARSETSNLSGSWSGGGTVRYSDGHAERARCRASFSPSGARVAVQAFCATPSGSVEQSASLRRTGPNSYSGSFVNHQFNISGSIHITVHGKSQTVSLRSPSGSASLTLRH